MDVARFKAQQAEAWGLGDYSPLSRLLDPAAQALCDACAVSAGQEALDVAAGDGNFALACAREGASVVATDLSPGMVERGRARSLDEGYDVEWQQADVEELPFEDARFDCVGSVFGAMLAPRPEVAARELFRVVRPGNTVGMAAWTPDSFPVAMFGVVRSYLPPPDDLPRSEEWGREDTVRERLDGLAANLELGRRSLSWEADSPEALADLLERDAPQGVAARSSLSPDQADAMRADFVELARRWSGDGPLSIEAEYLVIVARRRG